MKNLLLRGALAGLMALSPFLVLGIASARGRSSGGTVSVCGYTRKDGTYVAPYTRSAPGSGASGLTSLPTSSPTFSSCADAWAAGYSNMTAGSPGYDASLDRDGDGIACESGGSSSSEDSDYVTNISNDGLFDDPSVISGAVGDIDAHGVQYAPARSLRDLVNVHPLGAGRYSLTRYGVTLNLHIDSRDAQLGTAAYRLTGAPYLASEQLYLPLSALRAFNCQVSPNLPGNAMIDCLTITKFVDVALRTPLAIPTPAAANGAGHPQALKSAAKGTPTVANCLRLRLSTDSLQYKVLAEFPTPAHFVTVYGNFSCGPMSFSYVQGDRFSVGHKKLTVRGSDWRQMWAFLTRQQDLDTAIEPGDDKLVISNNSVKYVQSFDALPLDKNIVVALKSPNGKLLPLAFDGKISSQTLGRGVNSIYYRLISPWSEMSYQMIQIDTLHNVITFVPLATILSR